MTDLNFPRYLYIPMQVEWNSNLQNLDGKVYGVIYWFAQMSKKKCFASNRQIADILSGPDKTAKRVNPTSVANSICRLAKEGYVEVVMEHSQRAEIIPLITENAGLATKPSSINEGYDATVPHPSSNDEPAEPDHRPTHHLQMKVNDFTSSDPSSTDEATLHQMMNPPSSTDEQSNNI